jgi:hypothetical protein
MRVTCIQCHSSAESDDPDKVLDWYNEHKALHVLEGIE